MVKPFLFSSDSGLSDKPGPEFLERISVSISLSGLMSSGLPGGPVVKAVLSFWDMPTKTCLALKVDRGSVLDEGSGLALFNSVDKGSVSVCLLFLF